MGTKGQVTRSYANLCRKLWSKDVHSFAPIDLKIALSKYAPHLSGGGQHDSQVSIFLNGNTAPPPF